MTHAGVRAIGNADDKRSDKLCKTTLFPFHHTDLKLKISFSSSYGYRTTTFMNPEFQFPHSKVLQSVFIFFNLKSYIGIFGCIVLLIQNFYLVKILKK